MPSPVYEAFTRCRLTLGGVGKVYVAWPLLSRACAGWTTPSTVKVRLPVGMPAPGALATTVAVIVTFCPYTDGFADEVMTTFVSSLVITWSGVRVALPLE